MEERLGSLLLIVTLCFMLHAWILIDQTLGYSIGNCTIHGSLKESDRIKVFCYNLKYHTIPKIIPRNTEVFDICCNYISEVKAGDLKGLIYIKFLNLTRNQIYFVEPGAFRDQSILEELNLAKNRLTMISENYFQGLTQLRTLRLDSNYITSLESSAFSFLLNLRVMNLTHNRIQCIKQVTSIFKLPSLQELYVADNNISSFQSSDLLNSSITFGLSLLDLSYNPLNIFNITENILPKLQILDLSYSGPNGDMVWAVSDLSILSSVRKLNLSGIHMSVEGIDTVIKSVSMSLENLKLYNMKRVDVKLLLKDICQIPSLSILHLRRNNIKTLMNHTFPHCLQVRKLDLVDTKLTHLEPSVFSPLWMLNDLFLGHNFLNEVPKGLRILSFLKFLDLSFNKISKLTCSDFKNLTQLKSLHLFCNSISILQACYFQDLTNLQELLLGTNKILIIHDTFNSSLSNLRRLQLSSNKLSSIRKDDFQSLHSLEYLVLTDNQISKIDDFAFRGLRNLTQLSLSSNKITKDSMRSKVFIGMCNLKTLEIMSNYISYEKDSRLNDPPFLYLKSLTYLSIFSQGHKGLKNIPFNFLEGLTSLQTIHAGNLNINFLHPDIFKYTPQLQYLDISKNIFTTLIPEVFQTIPTLNKLVMSKGCLRSLDFLIQANLTRIRYLKAQQNQVMVINESVIKALPSLTFLNLQENAFTCDCSNAWFINWAVKNNITQVLGANKFDCSYPPNLRGTKLLDLDIDYCIATLGFLYYVATTVLVLLTLSVSFFYHFLRWHVVYAYYLFLAFHYDKKKKQLQKSKEFQYDAFISYNAQDEVWVMRELLPQLEQQQGWRLCLHHRDFQPGRPIIDNIVDGIYSSRKTICLISRHYLESEWCSREIQLASFRLFDEKKDVLVLVFLEAIPACQLSPYHRMRQLVKKHTYLTWPKPGMDTRIFWCKLKEALEMRNDPREEDSTIPVL